MTTDGCSRLVPLRILTRKWSYLVMRALRDPLGFSELKRELRFITSRVLSRELATLVQEGLIMHKSETYWLAPTGVALLGAAEPLMQWSVEHHGLRPCASSQRCSRCINYPQAVKGLVRIGK